MISIRIGTSNDAFGKSCLEAGAELARILEGLIRRMEDGRGAHELLDLKLLDSNGNECGSVRCTSEGWPTPPAGDPARSIERWVEPVAARIADEMLGPGDDRQLLEQALVLAFRGNPEVIRPLVGTTVIEESYFDNTGTLP